MTVVTKVIIYISTSPMEGVQTEYCDQHVGLSVSLTHISKTKRMNLAEFLLMLSVARSATGCVVVRCFVADVMSADNDWLFAVLCIRKL